MRCLRLYGKHDFRYEVIPDPIINDDQVLVKVKSVGICRSDIHYYTHGEIGGIKINEPTILGHEFSGEIASLGKNVTSFRIGDRVAVDPSISCGACEFCLRGDPNLCPEVKFCGTPPIMGALCELYSAETSQLFKIPDDFSFDMGALLEPLGVAIHSVKLAKLKGNESIAVLGAGSIGLMIIQLALLKNPKSISAFDILESRIQFAKKYNIESTLTINENVLNYKSKFDEFCGKFDVVFESAVSNNALNITMRLAKPGGKVIMIGIAPDENIIINSSEYRRKGLTLVGVRRMKETYPEAIDLVSKGKINFDGLVTHKFPLIEGASAFDVVENYKDNVIKAIINP